MLKFELWDGRGKKKFVIESHKKKSGEWLALCPFHDDHHESLRVNEGKKLWFCDVCGIGGPFYDPNYKSFSGSDRQTSKKIVAAYDYKDEERKLLFQVVRYSPKDFSQRRPNGKGGWIWNLKGVRRVLYRLPELIKGEDPVFIVEGEKDTDNLWKWGLTVTTCSGGVGKWKKEYNEFLRGKEIILIPDNDKQGFEHSKQVANSLFGIAKNIKWLELPGLREKQDVSDWIQKGGTKEEFLDLAKHTPEYDPTRKVYQLAGSYIKRGRGVIANFVITPKVRVQTDEGEFLKANIRTHTNKIYSDVQFSPDSWISKNRFKKALKGLLDLEYRGTDDDIQDIKGILASQEPPIKRGVKTTGVHKVDGEWIYVEEGSAWGKNGEREDTVYLADNPYLVSLLAEPTLTFRQLDEILSCLFVFNAEDVVYPLLGFCFACFVKERMIGERVKKKQNPLLISWGEKGSGKSETLEGIVKPIFGIESSIEDIAHPTEFGFARIISSSNLAPVLFDEHKPGRITQLQVNRISEMMRAVYNQRRITRGRPDLGITEFIQSAPVIIAGEMGVSELAIKDRIVETYFSKKKIESKEKVFKKLTHLSLGALGKDFLLWTLKLVHDQIKSMWDEQLESVDKELTDRLRENTAHARLGLALFSQYLASKGRQRIHKDILSVIDEAQKKNILEESNKTIVDTIIEAFSVMAGKRILEEGKHYRIDANMNLNLHISSTYPEFKKWARDYQWDGEILDKKSFLRQLKEAKYFIRNATIRFGDKNKWGSYLNLSQMNHLEIENFRS